MVIPLQAPLVRLLFLPGLGPGPHTCTHDVTTQHAFRDLGNVATCQERSSALAPHCPCQLPWQTFLSHKHQGKVQNSSRESLPQTQMSKTSLPLLPTYLMKTQHRFINGDLPFDLLSSPLTLRLPSTGLGELPCRGCRRAGGQDKSLALKSPVYGRAAPLRHAVGYLRNAAQPHTAAGFASAYSLSNKGSRIGESTGLYSPPALGSNPSFANSEPVSSVVTQEVTWVQI